MSYFFCCCYKFLSDTNLSTPNFSLHWTNTRHQLNGSHFFPIERIICISYLRLFPVNEAAFGLVDNMKKIRSAIQQTMTLLTLMWEAQYWNEKPHIEMRSPFRNEKSHIEMKSPILKWEAQYWNEKPHIEMESPILKWEAHSEMRSPILKWKVPYWNEKPHIEMRSSFIVKWFRYILCLMELNEITFEQNKIQILIKIKILIIKMFFLSCNIPVSRECRDLHWTVYIYNETCTVSIVFIVFWYLLFMYSCYLLSVNFYKQQLQNWMHRIILLYLFVFINFFNLNLLKKKIRGLLGN